MRMGDTPKRLRCNGRAEISFDDPMIAEFPGAQGVVRLTPIDIFPNCPRYIPDPATAKPSPYTPKAGEAPVEPNWKNSPAWKDVVPPRKA